MRNSENSFYVFNTFIYAFHSCIYFIFIIISFLICYMFILNIYKSEIDNCITRRKRMITSGKINWNYIILVEIFWENGVWRLKHRWYFFAYRIFRDLCYISNLLLRAMLSEYEIFNVFIQYWNFNLKTDFIMKCFNILINNTFYLKEVLLIF